MSDPEPPSRDSGQARGTPIDEASAIWDAHAAWWHATFTEGADVEYANEIVPLVCSVFFGRRRILDLGCGEGQVARALTDADLGCVVVGLDPSARQLEGARLHDSRAIVYVQGAAEEIPFRTRGFDGVVCSLVIEHCFDVDRVLEEVARVLAPGGQFLLLINHPLYQGIGSGFIDDQILGEQYWRVGPYLEERVAYEEVDQGVILPFAHRPLSRYLNPLAMKDLLLVQMYEPPPLPAFLEGSINPELEAAIPRLLGLLFEYRPRPTIVAVP